MDSYYGVLLANKQLEVAEQSMKTAQANLDRSQDHFESGVVVESDLLSAPGITGHAQARTHSRPKRFGTGARTFKHPCRDFAECFRSSRGRRRKKSPSNELEEAEKKAMELRPDLKRNRSEQEAQQKSVSVAKSSFGPRVNPFAGWEADNPTFVAGWRE